MPSKSSAVSAPPAPSAKSKASGTTTSVLYPIIGAVAALEKFLGPNRQWKVTNARQREFLDEVFYPYRDDLSKIPEIASMASRDYKAINAFLKSQGFNIQLDPFSPEDSIGAASVLKLLFDWKVVGSESIIKVGDRSFPAASMKRGVEFYSNPQLRNPVAKMETAAGDEVYISIANGPVSEEDLPGACYKITTNLKPVNDYSGLLFPMVDLDVEPDISWLIDMNTVGDDKVKAIIDQALQQTKLSLDHLGGKVESAVAIGAFRATSFQQPKPVCVIDKPFLVVVRRPGLSLPIFSGYIGTEDWKKPPARK